MQTAKIKLYYTGLRFEGTCSYADRTIFQDAGFVFDQSARKFYTSNYGVAHRLRDYADSETLKEIYKVILSNTPWPGALIYPAPLKPLYYQPPAARFVLARNRSYLGVAAGLGKTIMAALAINGWSSAPSGARIVYLCPSFLIRNVANELQSWCPHLGVEFFDQPTLFGNILIVPDSLLHREELEAEIQRFLYPRGTSSNHVKALIVDEAHRFKNDESDRTRRLLGFRSRRGRITNALVDLFDKVVFMSGSPMPNRALELFPILSKAAPQTIDFYSREQFGLKYCAGRYNGFGYDFSGSSNLKELAAKVHGTFMFRLRKDALKLPPCLEELLVIGEDMPSELAQFEEAILKRYSPEDLMKGNIEREFSYEDIHLTTYQRLLGMKKVDAVVQYVINEMEETEDNFIIFARHREVIFALELALAAFHPLVITGDVSAEKRFSLVKLYQDSPIRRILIGNLKAMGLGFNITKANRVLNVEPDWTPDTNNQGRDRAHRYGQTESVLVQYVVHENSVDSKVMSVNLRKTKLGSYV